MDDDKLLQPQQLDSVQADIQQRVDKDKDAESVVSEIVSTPAWKEVQSKLEVKIEGYEKGQSVDAALLDANISNERIGELTRVSKMVAQELKSVLADVLETVKAHEQ